jgi:hypothetical protein
MLHLLTWLMVVTAGGLRRLAADAVTAAVGGQGRVRDPASRCLELLVHPHEISFAGGEQCHDVVVVGLAFFGSLHKRHSRRVGCDDSPDRVARDAEHARDDALAMTGFLQGEDGGSGSFIQHRRSPSRWC